MGLEPVTSCLASRSRGWNEIETEEEASYLIAVRFWSESLSLSLSLSHIVFVWIPALQLHSAPRPQITQRRRMERSPAGRIWS